MGRRRNPLPRNRHRSSRGRKVRVRRTRIRISRVRSLTLATSVTTALLFQQRSETSRWRKRDVRGASASGAKRAVVGRKRRGREIALSNRGGKGPPSTMRARGSVRVGDKKEGRSRSDREEPTTSTDAKSRVGEPCNLESSAEICGAPTDRRDCGNYGDNSSARRQTIATRKNDLEEDVGFWGYQSRWERETMRSEDRSIEAWRNRCPIYNRQRMRIMRRRKYRVGFR